MRLTIRWKLILALALPMMALYAVMLMWDFHRERAAATGQMSRLVADGAANAASRLDGQLHGIAQAGESAAMLLGARNTLTMAALQATFRGELRQNPFIHAVCVAVEPGAVHGRAEAVVLTMSRTRGRVEVAETTGRFDPNDPDECPWYAAPRDEGRSVWTAAYIDPALDSRLVATYAVPIRRNDAFGGVVAVTVRLDALQDMLSPPSRPSQIITPAALSPLGTGATLGPPPNERPGGEPGGAEPEARAAETGPALAWSLAGGGVAPFMVIDRRGRILSYPDRRVRDDGSLLIRAEQRGLSDVLAAVQEAIGGQTDVVFLDRLHELAPGFVERGRHWMALAPIPSTGWVFATALPESRLMDPVLERLRNRTLFLAGGLVMLIALTIWTSIRITRPIETLAGAVREVAAGNLDVQVRGHFGNDEVGQLAGGFNRMVRQLKDHMRALARETSVREKVDSELRIARQIQLDLLPKTFPPFPERPEFELYALNRPARHVAGDFFDFFFTGSGKLTIVVADVSGKGVPAALLMAVTRTLVRNLALTGMAPGDIVTQTNAMLVADTSEAMFVTLFLAQYDPATGALDYVNAGHPCPYVLSHACKPRPFGGVTAPLLGITTGLRMGPIACGKERLAPGETLIVYTDGATEARAPSGQMLTAVGLETLIAAYCGKTPADLCQHIATDLDDYQHRRRVDDITLLALKRNR